MVVEQLPTSVRDAVASIAQKRGFDIYNLETTVASAAGENSYGLILRAKISSPNSSKEPFFCVIKIAPTNPARHAQMKVADYYKREVFMYENVLQAFKTFQATENIPEEYAFNEVPTCYYTSLRFLEEFIIVEDLNQSGYKLNSRKNLPTYALTVAALKALAKFHAMSFVLQARRPQEFKHLINEIQYKDNLFTTTTEPMTVEFAKKYIRRTKSMITDDKQYKSRTELSHIVQIFEENFMNIALKAVNGEDCAPHAVICHGDFWNNNILYKYDESNNPQCAKLIDFQMSRYASPILDIVHYLFACTEKPLRDKHFVEFLNIYYKTLSEHLILFNLKPEVIYPRTIFESHLRKYGSYGFCMAIFAVPFFISDSGDLPDLDKMSEAIQELSSEACDDQENHAANSNALVNVKKSRDLIEEFEFLTEKTIPVFKRRLIGIVLDLFRYDMAKELMILRKEDDGNLSKESN